jgi:hypothetical protein
MSIGLDTHDGGETHGALVEGLEEVGQNHDDQDTTINHLLEALVVFRADMYATAGVHLDLSSILH